MNFDEFEKEVVFAVKRLPFTYRKLLEREGIKIIPREKVPPRLYEKHRGKTIFGVFVGTSRKDRRMRYVYPEPTRIEIYMESFEKVFGPELSGEVKDRIYKTVVHEIAHYFGFDENQLRARGY